MKPTVKCDWKHCAHGMSVAASEGDGCYAGDPTDKECPEFISDADWDRHLADIIGGAMRGGYHEH